MARLTQRQRIFVDVCSAASSRLRLDGQEPLPPAVGAHGGQYGTDFLVAEERDQGVFLKDAEFKLESALFCQYHKLWK